MEPKRLVVVGAGAIGGGLGGLLAHAGFHVELVARGAHGDAIRAHGLEIRRPHERFRVHPRCWARLDDVEWRAGDAALVATKLYDTEAALDALRAAAGPDLPVVLAQNGFASDAWGRARFGSVEPTMVYLPAERLEPGRVDLHGAPYVGAVDVGPGAAWLSEWLVSAGVRSTVRPDLDRWRRAKWMTNLCGHAVATGHADLAPGLVAEGYAVLDAAGLDAASADAFDAYVGDIGLEPIDGCSRLAGGSTAQSLARGRPVEVEWLNGPLVRLAHEVGVPVPLNERVLAGLG